MASQGIAMMMETVHQIAAAEQSQNRSKRLRHPKRTGVDTATASPPFDTPAVCATMEAKTMRARGCLDFGPLNWNPLLGPVFARGRDRNQTDVQMCHHRMYARKCMKS